VRVTSREMLETTKPRPLRTDTDGKKSKTKKHNWGLKSRRSKTED